jgi:hypothetical protein
MFFIGATQHDDLVKSLQTVIAAKAGIQNYLGYHGDR